MLEISIYFVKFSNVICRQCSECDKESSGSEVERVDTSAPRKLRHCKDEANSTPTPPQEVQAAMTPSTPTTSKNSTSNVTNVTTLDTHTTPKVLINKQKFSFLVLYP